LSVLQLDKFFCPGISYLAGDVMLLKTRPRYSIISPHWRGVVLAKNDPLCGSVAEGTELDYSLFILDLSS